MRTTLLALHVFILSGLLLFALHRIKLLWLYARTRRSAVKASAAVPELSPAHAPTVCIQLPVYNEPLMIEGLLASVCALRWPAGRIEIQLLDDSTDETGPRAAAWLAAHPEAAARVSHLRRPNRAGYKAGALAYGNARSDAEFIAIFDADFRPAPDFLERLVPYFADPGVAVVQARWEFANRRAGVLPWIQGVLLDGHFVIEQPARAASGLFFNFNGTAGLWRRAALDASGGWSADTVTEDLDLSYRAQRLGWRFVYVADYAVPSELPENLTAFKAQQRRWTKGGMQVMRRQLLPLLRESLPGRVKREAAWHLCIGLVHPLLITFCVLFVPVLAVAGPVRPGLFWQIFDPLCFAVLGLGSAAYYAVAQGVRQHSRAAALRCLAAAPLVMAFGLALSVACAAAALEGLFARGGEFVRTPKGGRAADAGGLVRRLRARTHFAAFSLAEAGLGLVLLAGALRWGRMEYLWVASALALKGSAFVTVALLGARDLLPRALRAA
jgi:cellulose synthase/poly-beta-1,6-N-acetylglucosamine synthase-like glycosyltransferase